MDHFAECPKRNYQVRPGEELRLSCARKRGDRLTLCRWKNPYNDDIYPDSNTNDGYGSFFSGADSSSCGLLIKRGVNTSQIQGDQKMPIDYF